MEVFVIKKRRNIQEDLFWITILFFILGMIHISFSIIGLLCFVLPFIMYYRSKDRVWCKYYCPRAGMFTKILTKFSLHLKLPKWLKGRRIKKIVVYYFGINIFFATMSTIMTSIGRIQMLDYVRFMIVFRAPFTLPQLLTINLPDGLIHMSYRIYSMMFTSVIFGIVLGVLYLPRAWCLICPIQSLTKGTK